MRKDDPSGHVRISKKKTKKKQTDVAQNLIDNFFLSEKNIGMWGLFSGV